MVKALNVHNKMCSYAHKFQVRYCCQMNLETNARKKLGFRSTVDFRSQTCSGLHIFASTRPLIPISFILLCNWQRSEETGSQK